MSLNIVQFFQVWPPMIGWSYSPILPGMTTNDWLVSVSGAQTKHSAILVVEPNQPVMWPVARLYVIYLLCFNYYQKGSRGHYIITSVGPTFFYSDLLNLKGGTCSCPTSVLTYRWPWPINSLILKGMEQIERPLETALLTLTRHIKKQSGVLK